MQVEAFIKLYRPKLPLEGLAVKQLNLEMQPKALDRAASAAVAARGLRGQATKLQSKLEALNRAASTEIAARGLRGQAAG